MSSKRAIDERPTDTEKGTEASLKLLVPPKKRKRKHTDPKLLAFRMLVQQACAKEDLRVALEGYDKAVEESVWIEAQSFYNLLNLCDGLSNSRLVHVGTPKPTTTTTKTTTASSPSSLNTTPMTDQERLHHAQRIYKRMQLVQIPLTETACTPLVRLLARCPGHLRDAEALLDTAEATPQCRVKLRLYAPVLTAYAQRSDLIGVVRVWKRMAAQNLQLSEREYCVILAACCNISSCSVLVRRILTDLAEDVLIPSRATTQCIEDWFRSDFARKHNNDATAHDVTSDRTDEVASLLAKIPSPDVYGVSQFEVTNPSGWTTTRCRADPLSGRLEDPSVSTSSSPPLVTLQPVALAEQAWTDMRIMNEQLALTGEIPNTKHVFLGGGKGPRRPLDAPKRAQRQQHWKEFTAFLNTLHSVDIVIDGANVGYYETNYAGAPKHVDYRQIDRVVQHFAGSGRRRILLVMHHRHFSKSLMPSWARPLLQKWQPFLYQTPPGMNDDWFWLHAAFVFRANILTNDEMRDHHFQMVAPRSFTRWRERHQIRFRVKQSIELDYPSAYSRRMQWVSNRTLIVPLPKRGDPDRYLDGTHVAGDEAPLDEWYLVVQPQTSVSLTKLTSS